MTVASLDDETRGAAAFFACVDPACGLRFPVPAHTPWRGRCPRCHGAVVPVGETPVHSPEVRPPALSGPELSLLLDNWRSLYNVGAALRTADGAGVAHVYLCGITATPAHPKLAKTALGAEQSVRWSYHPDAVKLAATLKAQGAAVWVLEDTPHSEPLAQVVIPRDAAHPVVLVAGNEVAGVDPGLVALADRSLVIPMRGRKRSLNVAVATGIALYFLSL